MPEEADESGLESLREQIDDIDRRLVALLNERARVVVEVGRFKRTANRAIYAPDREQRVLERVRSLNEGPLPDSCIEAVWRELMSGSFALERPLRVGFLGPAGTFTHLAARRKFGASVEYDGLEDIAAIFEETARGHIDLGLVPIENSAIGGIGETLDALLASRVHVCAEVLLEIHHNLLSHVAPDAIRRVYSKPEVFAQCRRWLSAQLGEAERISVASSSKAAELAAGDEQGAALASTLAAELYGLPVQFQNVEDNPHNVTRFLVVARESAKPTGDDKTAMMFTTAHQPHALATVLDVFGRHGINLTHIDKRPSQRANWEYYFFVDCIGHQTDDAVRAAIEEARGHCLQLTVLGSFPRARETL